jgi:hypothetical protein
MGLVIRVILGLAGVIAALFVAQEASNFPLVQAAIALVLITAIVAALVLVRRER